MGSKSCRNEDRDHDDLKTSTDLTCWCGACGLHMVGHGVLIPVALPLLFKAPLCHSHASLLLISLQLMSRLTSASPSFLLAFFPDASYDLLLSQAKLPTRSP